MIQPNRPIPALFAELFDDAALFPPGNAAMPAALSGHGDYRTAWYSDLVGLFVCPTTRLAELDDAVRDSPFLGKGISLTVPGGIATVEDGLGMAGSYPWMTISAVETPLPVADLDCGLDTLSALQAPDLSTFAEVAIAEVTERACAQLLAAGVSLKLRTGGTTAAAFPSAQALGAAIDAAVGSGLRFKCTAGLHNAIAHHDPSTGFDHHGFLNVLLGIHDSLAGRGAASALAVRDAATVIEGVRALSSDDVGRIRSLISSIGSCSIAEPLTDLQKADLVMAP
ncbi:MAG TPA: hypothetical protein VGH11_08645 [Jatrophihabitans sp.]